MGIETAARRLEQESRSDPESAARSMALLTEVQQARLLEQMRKDAQTNGASFSYERDAKTGEITAITYASVTEVIRHEANKRSEGRKGEELGKHPKS